MPKYTVLKIGSQPGILRDGTAYNSPNYTDGQWCRFWEGSPRSIGGYVYMLSGNNEPVRDMFSVSKPSAIDLYLGRASTVSFVNLNYNGIPIAGGTPSAPNGNALIVETDRTPLSGFSTNPNNLWDFDLFTDVENFGESTVCVVAQVAPNADDLSNTEPGAVFYGSIDDNTPLRQISYEDATPVIVSGGIVSIPPLVVAYGNDGNIVWNTSGNITDWPKTNFLNIGTTKVIKGFNLRGSSPTGIFWTLNSVVRVQLTQINSAPGVVETTFVSSTIDSSITVLSPDSIVEYDQMYFWIGTDQFYFFNGIVNKLPNVMNSNFFFEGIDLKNRSKVWGMLVRKYSEIWWFYPRLLNQDGTPNTSGECNAAIIFNVQSSTWYDTWIDRGSGVPTSIFPFPIMASNKMVTISTTSGVITSYPIWLHEQGSDVLLYQSGSGNPAPINSDPLIPGTHYQIGAIKSWFTTAWIDLFSQDPNASVWLANRRIAPDFSYLYKKDAVPAPGFSAPPMTFVIANREYPQSNPIYDPVTVTVDPTEGGYEFWGDTPFIDVTSQGAIVSFTFTSNAIFGSYQMGKTLYFLEKGDTLK